MKNPMLWTNVGTSRVMQRTRRYEISACTKEKGCIWKNCRNRKQDF
jgi:hypothetical protein